MKLSSDDLILIVAALRHAQDSFGFSALPMLQLLELPESELRRRTNNLATAFSDAADVEVKFDAAHHLPEKRQVA